MLLSLNFFPKIAESERAIRENSVRLALPSCEEGSINFPHFLSILRVELASDGFLTHVGEGPDRSGSQETLLISLNYSSCRPDVSTLIVTILDTETNRSLSRLIRLEDVVSEARPRSLALVVIELFREFLDAVDPDPNPPSLLRPGEMTPTAETVDAEDQNPEPTEFRRFLLGCAFLGRIVPRSDGGFIGGDVGFSVALSERFPFRFRTHLSFAYSQVRDSLGSLEVMNLNVSMGPTVEAKNRFVSLETGPLVLAGWLRGAGEGSETNVVRHDLVVALGWMAITSVAISNRVHASILLSLGHTVQGVSYTTSRGATNGFDKLFFECSLGFHFAF